ncbi:UNVERIFIED_CONTAM: hypothetical protein GTU68_012743 [Idotea baltica]|nr:hypothetical protein [Idotea baltica]
MWIKETVDRVGAVIILLLTLPLWLFALIGIRLASPEGPVMFKQVRSGRYGKEFTMFKFRTMHPDAESRRGEFENDPRVFKFGSLLRKTSIDELPQLLNIIRGEMSLVGPRPLPVYEIARIENNAQRRRLSVKPGLTCLWQVSGRSKITSFEDWVQLDLEYIDNWSLWLDWKILAKTVPVVLGGVGAK